MLPFPARFVDDVRDAVTAPQQPLRTHNLLQRWAHHLRANTFVYQDLDARRIGSHTLILLLAFLGQQLDHVIVPVYYEYADWIRRIAIRQEFDLKTYSRKGLHNIKNTEDIRITMKPILQEYTHQLRILYYYCLDKLTAETLQERHRAFFADMLPIFYFRLPKMMDIMLEALNDAAITDVPYDQQLMNQLDRIITNQTISGHALPDESAAFIAENPSLFEWVLYSSEEDKDTLDEDGLGSIDALQTLFSRFQDTDLFYSSIESIISHAREQVGVSNEIPWKVVHGYWTILRSFCMKISAENPRDYSRATRQCIQQIASYSCIAGPLIEMILRHTNVYDRVAVFKCIETLETIFNESLIPENDLLRAHSLPEELSDESWYVMLQAFTILLESEDFQILGKTLTFIYYFLTRQTGQKRVDLFSLLIREDLFMKFFLHWNIVVRRCYHVILVFQVRRRGFLHSYETATDYCTNSEKRGLVGTISDDYDFPIGRNSSGGLISSVTGSLSKLFHSLYSFDDETEEETEPSPIETKENERITIQSVIEIESGLSVPCFCVDYGILSAKDLADDESIENRIQSLIFSLNMSEDGRRRGQSALEAYESLLDERKQTQRNNAENLELFRVIIPTLPAVALIDLRDEDSGSHYGIN